MGYGSLSKWLQVLEHQKLGLLWGFLEFLSIYGKYDVMRIL